jgi:hypothetical protein
MAQTGMMHDAALILIGYIVGAATGVAILGWLAAQRANERGLSGD